MRKATRYALRALSVLIGVPLLLALAGAVMALALNRTNGSLVSSGGARAYLLHVPATYDPARPAPLVISLHAAAMWPAHQMHTSRWNRLADEHGFLVVYPSGTGVPRVWRAVQPGRGLEADVRFISDLIDTLQAQYAIDPERIYANGLSNGGAMAFALSCALSDRIAAVGGVATAQVLPASWCAGAGPMPMMPFHGTGDRIVPYAGGETWMSPRPFIGVREWTGDWARRNSCAGSTESAVAADATRLAYLSCADDAAVVLYTMQEGGHSWPGGKPMPATSTVTSRATVSELRAAPLRGAPAFAVRLSRREAMIWPWLPPLSRSASS